MEGIISLIVLALTFSSLIFGALFGMIRGRNRAILRLGLVIVSIILSITLRSTVVNFIMNLNVGDATLRETIIESMTSGGSAVPQFIVDLVLSLFQILISVVAFYLFFIILRIVTGIILFPILKIFVKKGEKKGILFGMLMGIVQGIIISFVVFAPLSGMLVQVERISEIEMDGSQLFELPEELGIKEYNDSAIGKFYYGCGNWFFNLISSGRDTNGNKININDMFDIVATFAELATTVNDLSSSMDVMSNPDATPQEQVNAMRDIGEKLKAMGSSIDELDEDQKELVNSVISGIKDLVVSENGEMTPELEETFNNLSLENIDLAAAGDAMSGIATYIEKTNDEFANSEPVTQEEVNSIVNGIANNPVILNTVTNGEETSAIIEVSAEDAAMFENAINSSTVTDAEKDNLRRLFGLK